MRRQVHANSMRLFLAALLLCGAALLRPAIAVAPAPGAARDGSSVESAQRISDIPGCGEDGSLQPATDTCNLNIKLSGGGASRWWVNRGAAGAARRQSGRRLRPRGRCLQMMMQATRATRWPIDAGPVDTQSPSPRLPGSGQMRATHKWNGSSGVLRGPGAPECHAHAAGRRRPQVHVCHHPGHVPGDDGDACRAHGGRRHRHVRTRPVPPGQLSCEGRAARTGSRQCLGAARAGAGCVGSPGSRIDLERGAASVGGWQIHATPQPRF